MGLSGLNVMEPPVDRGEPAHEPKPPDATQSLFTFALDQVTTYVCACVPARVVVGLILSETMRRTMASPQRMSDSIASEDIFMML
jgi:hypothetical protein